MKVYLNKCKRCKKKFRARKGGFLQRLIDKGGQTEVVNVPWYGMAGVKCPRCGCDETKTLAVLNIK